MENTKTETKTGFSQRHGGPWDRGSADSYYGRPRRPHWFTGDSYSSQEVLAAPGTNEWEAYNAGYDWNERQGLKKDWG